MGNDNENDKPELTNTDIINQLKKILHCLKSEEGKICTKINDGDDWFNARKHKLNIPTDSRADELKKLLEEKENNTNLKAETILNTIYPSNKENDVQKVESKGFLKETNKPYEPEKPPIDNKSIPDYPSQVENNNAGMGLLHGPYMGPFVTELRGGKVIVGCQCTKRNGMQADCERKLCLGKNACLQLPLPLCVPSGFGKLKPKEIKIFIGEVQSCPKEESSIKIKSEEVKKKLNIVKDYIDNPPVPYISPVCKPHKKGRYYLRPLRRHKNTQTQEVELPEESQIITKESCSPEISTKIKTITK